MHNKPPTIWLRLNPTTDDPIELTSRNLHMRLEDVTRARSIQGCCKIIGIKHDSSSRTATTGKGQSGKEGVHVMKGPCNGPRNSKALRHQDGRCWNGAPDNDIPIMKPPSKAKMPYPAIERGVHDPAAHTGAELRLEFGTEQTEWIDSTIDFEDMQAERAITKVNYHSPLFKISAKQDLRAWKRSNFQDREMPSYRGKRRTGNRLNDWV